MPELRPDVTRVRRDLDVTLEDVTTCRDPPLPRLNGHVARTLSVDGPPLVVRAWETPLGGGDYCALVVVVNLCSTPSTYALRVPTSTPVNQAAHLLAEAYNVSLANHTLHDTVDGHTTATLLLGCDLWLQQARRGAG